MMFIHHFYTFPAYWIEGISYPLLEKITPYLCKPFKLCVPIFAFLTGYFYSFNENRTLRYSLNKIKNILIPYWCVFFPSALIAALWAHYDYTILDFILECFALKRPTMFFCWYVSFYIVIMLTIPLITKMMTNDIHLDLFIGIIFLPFFLGILKSCTNNSILTQLFDVLLSYFPVVLIGYLFGSYGLFEKIDELSLNSRLPKMTMMFLSVIFVPFGRLVEPKISLVFSRLPSIDINLDCIYAPVFIYAIVNINKVLHFNFLDKQLSEVGKYSVLMWFVSCIFFNNCKLIFQPILYWPHNPILVTLWGLLLCFSISFVLDIVVNKIQNIQLNASHRSK